MDGRSSLHWHKALGRAVVAGVLLGCAAGVQAQQEEPGDYLRRLEVRQRIEPQGDSPFGESLNPYTGELTFQHPDVIYPGIGPTIRLIRYSRSAQQGFLHNPKASTSFETWALSIPSLSLYVDASGWVMGDQNNPNRYARCTHFGIPKYFGNMSYPEASYKGTTLATDGGQEEIVLQRSLVNNLEPVMPDGSGNPMPFPLLTKSNWQIGCLPQTSNGEPGEAFVAVSPEGLKYYLDRLVYSDSWRIYDPQPPEGVPPQAWHQDLRLATMYVTRIEDRFGNYLAFDYGTDPAGDKLQAINASDGRQVQLTWSGDHVTSIKVQPGSPSAQTWTYTYTTSGNKTWLSKVTLPDGSAWTFSQNAGTKTDYFFIPPADANYCNIRSRSNSGTPVTTTLTSPTGLTGSFVESPIWHGRNYVPSVCIDPEGLAGEDPYEQEPPLFHTLSLVQKTFSGPGIPSRTWTYTYAPATGSTTEDACAAMQTCPTTTWVDVTDPAGNRKRFTYNNVYGATEGQLEREDTYQGTSTLLRTVTYQYAASNQGPWPCRLGGRRSGPSSCTTSATPGIVWQPLKRRVITQQGVTFTHEVTAFDEFANPVTEVDSSSLGYSRTTQTTYEDTAATWVLGQVATVTINGIQASRTDYDSLDRPWKTYAFGKLTRTLSYNTDGTIASIKDANNNTTTFSNWKRGIPQAVHFPATPESPSGATRSAVVNDLGWITSVTDEAGYTTSYAYDAMGRISQITYPSGDSTTWSNTTSSFVRVGSAEYGIAANHWRQTVSTGNARKVTYFDAMWRPILVREYDNGNIAGTERYTATAYDAEGRPVDVSYPLGTAPSLASNGTWLLLGARPPGVRTTYDALGRTTQVDQDSELPGLLTTTTEYLSSFRTRVTNPRGYASTTSYMAWDAPVTDYPVAIAMPEGAYTDISRDAFGKPLSITRRNASGSVAVTRHFVYDAYQRLCKTVEPETGATVMDYDDVGNLVWSASGLSLPGTTSCDRTSVPGEVKVTRAYDARNRLTTLSFPDGKGDQAWAYTPDGLPAQIQTANDTPADIVTNAYAYNKRRLPVQESLGVPGQPTWILGYGYASTGALTSITYPDGETVSYAPNALGQPTQAGSYATGVTYYPNGAMAGFTYGNGIVHSLVQNARGLPERSRDSGGVLDDSYDYDANGNVVAISDGLASHRGDRDMAYDGLDRLTSTLSPMYAPSGAHYSYDVLDNLTHVVAPGRDHWYCYDGRWQLTNVKTGSCSGASEIGLGYDPRGNLENKNGQAFVFDFGNRLRSATGLESYRYDGHGRRASATSSAGSVYSFYGHDGVLRYQRDERQLKAFNYISLNGSLLARKATTITLSTVPAAPTLTAPATSSTGSYTVSWSAPSGATTYRLEERVGSGSWTEIHNAAGTSKSISGKPNGSYSYRVRACNTAGCSSYSATKSVVVELTPQPPTLSAPASSTTGNYTVSWTTSAGATTYKLEERIGSGSWTEIHNAAGTSKSISGKPNGSYSYRVSACNSTCSGYSNVTTVSVSFPGVTPPPPVLSVPATSTTGSYSVTWSTSFGATEYRLDERIGSGSWSEVLKASATSKAFSGKPNGSYSYRVRACSGSSASDCSDYSAVGTIVVTLPPPPPGPPTVSPSPSFTGSYTVSWAAASGATSYRLEEQVGSGGWTEVMNADATSKVLTDKADGTYSYRLRACSASGCSTFSSLATVTVNKTPPTLTVPSTSSTGSYTVSWTSVANATHHELAELVGSTWTVIQDTSASNKAISGKGNGTYGYRVRACNGSGTSNCSAYSTTKSIVVDIPPPLPPTPTLTGYAEQVPDLKPPRYDFHVFWTASTGATYYELMRGTTTAYSGAALSYTWFGAGGQAFQVRACNSAGCSAWSDPLNL